MTATLLSFATQSYADMQTRLHDSGGTYFNSHLAKREADLPDWFREQHAQHFLYARGYGFWVWKPWLILKTLQQIKGQQFGSKRPPVLMYCDSQLVFVSDPGPLFNICRQNNGVLLFHQAREKRTNGCWTKRYCFEAMDCMDPSDPKGGILEKYEMGWQLNTAMSVWAPTDQAFDVLKEWYSWCSKFDVVCDDRKLPGRELNKFKDHRHDQSILSIIAIRRGLRTFPDPSEWGNGYQEDVRGYKQILQFKRQVRPPYKHPCYEPGGVTG